MNIGLIHYDDGASSPLLGAASATEAASVVETFVDRAAATETIGTYVRCVGFNDCLYYQSAVGDTVGWRILTAAELSNTANPTARAVLQDQLVKFRGFILNEGFDPVRVCGERAVQNGLHYFISHRMNDPHYISEGYYNIGADSFRIDSNGSVCIDDDITRFLDYDDFSVRTRRAAIIHESIDRYHDVIDGVQIDFMRHPILFDPQPDGATQPLPGTDLTQRAMITALLSDIRDHLNAVASSEGRSLYLSARIPPLRRDCEWLGLDVADWMASSLVDILSPSLLYDSSHSLAVADLATLIDPTKQSLYPTVLLGTRYTTSYAFKAAPVPADYSPAETNLLSLDVARGAAAVYRSAGASGIEMYNFQYGNSAQNVRADAMAEALGTFDVPGTDPMVFAVTPARENNWKDTAGYSVPPLPVVIDQSAPSFTVPVHLGEVGAPTYVGIRVGLTGLLDSDVIEISWDSSQVYSGVASGKLIAVSGNQSPTLPKTHFLQVAVPSPLWSDLVPGEHRLTMTVSIPAGRSVTVTDMQVGVTY